MEKNAYLDGIMGLVVGDALGVPVEFARREELRAAPVTDMTGHGTYPVPAGAWSDDSSMALATLAALLRGYDRKAIMDNFVAWEQRDEFTPTGELFDEGNTCAAAISNYIHSGDVDSCGLSDANSNGNGSLMRILPMCIYVYHRQKAEGLPDREAVHMIHQVSALTHAHKRSKMACGLYYFCTRAILDGAGSLQQRLQAGLDAGFSFYGQDIANLTELAHFGRIRDLEGLKGLPEDSIYSGGYVIESIESALLCLVTTQSYSACVLKAVNLGYDTDTTAAIAGGLAGLYYGYDAIPESWRNTILRREYIESLCKQMNARHEGDDPTPWKGMRGLLGAAIGDIVGSVYEWDNIKTKEFPLFEKWCKFTDDTVMTMAVAEGLMKGGTEDDFIDAIKKYGRMYPRAGYGGRFKEWLFSEDRAPYHSWGNGSAMRVSPVGWVMDCGIYCQTGIWPEEGRELARRTAAVTHDHPEGIKGAQAVADAILICRLYGEKWRDSQGNLSVPTIEACKALVKSHTEEVYGYDLSQTLDEIRPTYQFDVSCQGSVPQAITAFLESTDFEDAIRSAISLGGDSDTIAAITGSIAEAAYGIPDELCAQAWNRLDASLRAVCRRWKAYMQERCFKWT